MPLPFLIPAAFLALESAGRFDYWGAPYRELTDKQREGRMRSHMTQVLWWRPIEWDRTSDEIAAFTGDDFLRPGLVPFAGDGFGNQYCWYPSWQAGPDVQDESYVEREALWDAHFGILRPWLTPEQIDLLASVRANLSAAACDEADTSIAARVPARRLTAIQLPTRYDHQHVDRDTLIRLYDESIAFFRDLVEVEGRRELAPKLQETQDARAGL
jgi:hypothetical protein